MQDIAEFVMDYILSDVRASFRDHCLGTHNLYQVLGLIAINWLIIADQSEHGILDRDCLTLANLHSDAVDYPKSGYAVDPKRIPKLHRKQKPDWNAPETVNAHNSHRYYESKRYIGRLFRKVVLPAEQQPLAGATHISSKGNRSGGAQDQQDVGFFARDFYYDTIERHVQQFISTDEPFGERLEEEAEALFMRYSTELQGICITHSLSTSRKASLTEEEAMIGTIIQKTSQPRHRKDVMSRLRESTDILVRGIRECLEGEEGEEEEAFLQRSWYAFQVALRMGRQFGAQSFAWVALGGIFEAIRDIQEREEGRHRQL